MMLCSKRIPYTVGTQKISIHRLSYRTIRPCSTFHRYHSASPLLFSSTYRTINNDQTISSSDQRQYRKEKFGTLSPKELKIVNYPHPSLRGINSDVTVEEINDGSIMDIAKSMLELMYEAEGIGLAAPQVGINKRLMVYNETGLPVAKEHEVILINPKIVKFSKKTENEEEMCLSIPEYFCDIDRSIWIAIEAIMLTNRTRRKKGIKKIRRKLCGDEARIFQHEFDHLEGTLIIDKADELDLQGGKLILDQLEEAYKKC